MIGYPPLTSWSKKVVFIKGFVVLTLPHLKNSKISSECSTYNSIKICTISSDLLIDDLIMLFSVQLVHLPLQMWHHKSVMKTLHTFFPIFLTIPYYSNNYTTLWHFWLHMNIIFITGLLFKFSYVLRLSFCYWLLDFNCKIGHGKFFSKS